MSLHLLQLPTVCAQLALHFCNIPELLRFARLNHRCSKIVQDPFTWACVPLLQIDSVTFDSSAPIQDLLRRGLLRHVGLFVRWTAPPCNSGIDESNSSALASVTRLIAMPRIRVLITINGSLTANKEPHPNWSALLLGEEPLPALAGIQRMEVGQAGNPLGEQASSLFHSEELVASLPRSMPRLHMLALRPSRFDQNIPPSLLLPLASSSTLTALSFDVPLHNARPLLRSLLELRCLQKLHLEVRMIETLCAFSSTDVESESSAALAPWPVLRHVRISASAQSGSHSRVTLAADAMCRLMPSLETLQLQGHPDCGSWVLPLRAHCPSLRTLLIHVTRTRLQLQPLLTSDHTPLLLTQLRDLLLVSSLKWPTPVVYAEVMRKVIALSPQKVRRIGAVPEAFLF